MFCKNAKISKAEWVASEVDLWVSNKSPVTPPCLALRSIHSIAQASIDLVMPDGGKVSLDPATHKVFKTYHGDQWAASLNGKRSTLTQICKCGCGEFCVRPTVFHAVDFENGKVQEFVVG